jgi:hypothetical protein
MTLKDKLGKPADPEKIKKLIKKFGGSETDVWAVCPGFGFVRFDGTTVVIRQTSVSRIVVGKGEKRIPARQITAIQIKPAGPFVTGFIQFSLGGSNEVRSSFGRQSFDATKDENSMSFSLAEQNQFEALRDAIEAAAASPQTGQPAPAADPLDQLRKLAELRDSVCSVRPSSRPRRPS